MCGQVYKISIGAACNLSWPSDRLVIQVLDDSTDYVIKVVFLSSILYSPILRFDSVEYVHLYSE